MGLEENKAVVQRLFDAINSGNLDELPEGQGCAGGHPHAAGGVPGSGPSTVGFRR
jgi:hypothetical protein